MTDKAIKNLINDLADVSDISGASDSSDNNETYIPIEGWTKGDSDDEEDDEGGEGGLGEAHEDLLGDVRTMGDGPDGVPHVQGDVDTEEKEDNHNEASSNILNNSNISKRRKIEKINHNWTEDDLPAG